MTRYNVHLYREMRLTFEGIEADSPEEAAAIASARSTEDAAKIEDCDGDDLGALVDVVGDEQFEQSRMIDFEGEQLRKTAPKLLKALLILEKRCSALGWSEPLMRIINHTIAEATGRAA